MMATLRIVWLTGTVFPSLGYGHTGPLVLGKNNRVRRTPRHSPFYQQRRKAGHCAMISTELGP
jgi:hypothetical protein